MAQVSDIKALLAAELEVLAKRGIVRVFRKIGKNGPLDLPVLFKIVEQRYPAEWAGTETQRTNAIRDTLTAASRDDRLGEPVVPGKEKTHRRMAEVMYELVDVNPKQIIEHRRRQRYSTLVSILKDEVSANDPNTEHFDRRTGRTRELLTESLLCLPKAELLGGGLAVDTRPTMLRKPRFMPSAVGILLLLIGASPIMWDMGLGRISVDSRPDETTVTNDADPGAVSLQPPDRHLSFALVCGNRTGCPVFDSPFAPTRIHQELEFMEAVEVSCKIRSQALASVPWWYFLAGEPNDGESWTPANTFFNGDPVNGPYANDIYPFLQDC